MMGRRFVAQIALALAMAILSSRVYAQSSPGGGPVTAAETEQRAREAFQRGRIHYDNGEFDQASKAFEEAYSLSGRHALLYNLYLAYRDANQQEKAAEALRNYLARVEVIENRPQLEARLKALDEGIAARKAAEAREQQAQQEQQPTVVVNTGTTAPQNDAAAPANRWWLMPVSLMGAGGALMLGSVATGVMASSKQSELNDKCMDGTCPSSLKSTADSGKTLALITDVLLFGGAAVAATGTVLFFLKKPKRGDPAVPPAASANLICTSRVCGASMHVRF